MTKTFEKDMLLIFYYLEFSISCTFAEQSILLTRFKYTIGISISRHNNSLSFFYIYMYIHILLEREFYRDVNCIRDN